MNPVPADPASWSVARQVSFWSKVEFGWDCWIWMGYIDRLGYGHFGSGRKHANITHRIAFELAVGPIPERLTIDHLCHTTECKLGNDCPHRRCVRPAHLEPTSLRTNLLRGGNPCAIHARQTHCINGHEFTEANTYWRTHDGGRRCRTCGHRWQREYQARKRITLPEQRREIAIGSVASIAEQ